MSGLAAVVFDLDGVLVHTDGLHRTAWEEIAARQGWSFDDALADSLRGVSREESLDLIAAANGTAVRGDRRTSLTGAKDARYRELIQALTPSDVTAEVRRTLAFLREAGWPLAVGSASRNASSILARVGLADAVDVIVDGTMTSRSKPDPEVFETAARRLGVPAAACAVVEDAVAGIAAARAAGCFAISVTAEAARAADAHIDGLGRLHDVLPPGPDLTSRSPHPFRSAPSTAPDDTDERQSR